MSLTERMRGSTRINLGLLSFGPIAILTAGSILQAEMFPFTVAAIVVSVAVSACFMVIGVRRHFGWMTIWAIAFFLLLPFSNIAFWLFHRRKL